MKPEMILFITISLLQLAVFYSVMESTAAAQSAAYEVKMLDSTLAQLITTQENFIDAVDRLNMYDEDLKIKTKLAGIYRQSEFYCVWTKGRDYCDIANMDPSLNCVNETALHELSHDLAFKDYEHFCTDDARFCQLTVNQLGEGRYGIRKYSGNITHCPYDSVWSSGNDDDFIFISLDK